MATYTLATLRDNLKRRIRQIRATTDAGTEAEGGALASNQAIYDAINAARKKIMVTVKNAELWGRAAAKFTTSANVQEYALGEGVLRIDGVQYDVTSDGLWQTATRDAKYLPDIVSEQAVINYPSNQPSITNPFYRVTNKGVRLIVSTNGTVTASKYIRVEFLKELTDLTAVDTESGLTGMLDEMVINYAIFIVCEHSLPNIALVALNDFINQAYKMNLTERLNRDRRV